MGTKYETDVVAWASEQAGLIRASRFDLLDLEHIADEIEDVGKGEKREFARRMSLLLAQLLMWQFLPERQGNSWARTIKARRDGVARRLRNTPSLRGCLTDPDWWADAWMDAVSTASKESEVEYAALPIRP